MKEPTKEQIIKAAIEQYEHGHPSDIQIDDDAEVSKTLRSAHGDPASWWVQAWVYVREEDLEI